MKSKIISTLLCVIVLCATFWLLFKAPTESPKSPDEQEETKSGQPTPQPSTEISRAYVIEAAHDAEDLMEELAFGTKKDYESALSDLVLRLSSSAEYLKNDLQDYYGASYFTKVSEIFQEISSTPFANSSDFSQRASRILTELENAFPADVAAGLDENDPEEPMYYPQFDTDVNGKTTLALLAIYRCQYQKNTGSILLTFGGNVVFGDTLLGAEKDGSFKSYQEKSNYTYPLYKLSSVLSTDSSSFSNLEAPFTESIGDSTVAGSVKGLPDYAELLKEGGINAVSIANPGILSFGETGKSDTKKALKDADVLFSDEGTVAYHQTSLGTVAYLTYDIIDEIQSNVNLTYADAPRQDIAAAKQAGAKFVVVHFNWTNTEKNAWDPCMAQVLSARAAVDNGADLVFGSHQGSVEAIEQYKGVSIVYSSGDLFLRGGESESSFLFQQAFTLDENGNAVPGEIQVFPLAKADGAEGLPSFALDSESAANFRNTITSFSGTVRYGVGKRSSFTADHLNIISIQK